MKLHVDLAKGSAKAVKASTDVLAEEGNLRMHCA
jgi:hypothetical protein